MTFLPLQLLGVLRPAARPISFGRRVLLIADADHEVAAESVCESCHLAHNLVLVNRGLELEVLILLPVALDHFDNLPGRPNGVM